MIYWIRLLVIVIERIGMINLTQKQIDMFSIYCLQEAKSEDDMAELIKKSGAGDAMTEALIKRYKHKAAAFFIIGEALKNTEVQ